jgi:hypothetical protein
VNNVLNDFVPDGRDENARKNQDQGLRSLLNALE